ncbi:MAG: aminodeoxychorismate synthase component I [Xanthomonadales bacterium]|nr:aminodeoxychorismate synthase component I [Xanthomonadales bacterium]
MSPCRTRSASAAPTAPWCSAASDLTRARVAAVIAQPAPAHGDPLALVAAAPERYPAFLESAAESPRTGTLDLLPVASGERIVLGADGVVRDQGGRVIGSDFAAALDAAFAAAGPAPARPAGLPFAGGWLLYLGYEAVAQFEPGLRLPVFEGAGLPVALALRTPAAWLRPRPAGDAVLVAEPGHAALCRRLASDLDTCAESASASNLPGLEALDEDPPERFLAGVARILEYLRAGDVFQVNLSRAWQARFAEAPDPVVLYRCLREASPAPFSALLRFAGAALLSASPERLLRVRGTRIDTRPIAGTRPRGADEVSDRALLAELIGHPKERAEHVMLIDLERNDLGRVCRPGSIRVDELMALESYSHVHHIVSNVSGELRPGTTPGAILRALFPGGTITGCPKVRCMEIIAELEGTGRGPYTGAIGYLDRSGDMDLNILIRSAWQQGRTLGFRTGAGIVADSVPARELAETRSKAGGLLAALGHR